MTSNRSILHLRFDMPPGLDAELPEQLRRLLENITPRVQMIEPDSAALDLTGALPYFHQDARGLTELIQLRVLAYFGVSSAAGAAPSRMLAAMACALTGPGRRLVIEDPRYLFRGPAMGPLASGLGMTVSPLSNG